MVMTSHCDGEVWGLALVELDNGDMRLLTSCDDNRILAYNPKTKEALAEGTVSVAEAKPKKKKGKKEKPARGGASSMSSQPATG